MRRPLAEVLMRVRPPPTAAPAARTSASSSSPPEPKPTAPASPRAPQRSAAQTASQFTPQAPPSLPGIDLAPLGSVLGQLARAAKGAALPVISGALGEVGKNLPPEVMRSLLGPEYPADPVARAQDRGRVEQALEPLLQAMPPEARAVVDRLRQLGVDDVDLFRGSHTIVEDGGALYEQLKGMGATPRDSSHYPDVDCQQYEANLPGLGVVLFGKDAQGNTWFQVEAHGLAGSAPDHALDTLKYWLGGQNIGPLGVSPHTEHGEPLRVPGQR